MPSVRGTRHLAVFALIALAACSASDDSVSESELFGDASSPSTVPTGDLTSTEPEPIPDGPLAEVCPATVVIQTTGEPGVPLGPLYLLAGPDAVVEEGAVSGPFTRADGTVDDITLVVRSGGPATGFQDAVSVAAADDTITFVHTSISAMLRRHSETAMVAVAVLTDRSHVAVLVDPVTYPGVAGLDDVAAAGIEIRHFTDAPAFEFLGSTGTLSPGQLVDGFDGGPATFVAAEGTIAQQGDLLVDPALFASLPQWSRPVTAISLGDAGWDDHDDVLAVPASALEDRSECLARVVPLVQQAIGSYADDPAATNVLLAQARTASDPLSRVTAELLDVGAEEAVALGVIGEGVDGTVGDVDADRLGPFLPELAAALGVDEVPIDELIDDSFIDPAVGL